MRFYLIPVGKEFNYRGKTYIKAGPLTASPKTGGKDKLIQRSAEVELVGDATQSEPVTSEVQYLSKNEVINTFNTYHNHYLELLKEISTESTEDLQDKLDKLYQELMSSLFK